MDEEIIPVIPISPGEEILEKKFYEDLAAQEEMVSKAIVQLLTVELAIPGIFTGAFQFGEKSTVLRISIPTNTFKHPKIAFDPDGWIRHCPVA